MKIENQKIAINPSLRDDFDNTPHDERHPSEISEWWDRPYIVTCTFQDNQADRDYDAWAKRLSSYSKTDLLSREDWEAERKERKADWYVTYPTGIRYEVLCLDGNCRDRPTSWGFFGSLEEAIKCAKGR
jgi:hypothetical protein